MEKNFHRQKLIALVIGAACLIALFLPWISLNAGLYGGGSANGLRSWGLLSLLGVGAVAASVFMGDKLANFDDRGKKLAQIGFGGVAAGALIFFLRLSSISGASGFGVSTGIGLWICLLAGLAGLAFLFGVIKIDTQKPR